MSKMRDSAFTRQDFLDGDMGREVEELFQPLPCEKCGTTETYPEDRVAMIAGARAVPVNEIDARAGRDGKRLVRICEPCYPAWGHYGFFWPAFEIATPRRCPRCTGWIPTDQNPGEYQGAMSRVRVGRGHPANESFPVDYADRSVEICSPCGEDEAIGHGIVPIEEWPVPWAPTTYAPQVREALREGRLTLVDEATGEPVDIDIDAPINIRVDDEVITEDSEVTLQVGAQSFTPDGRIGDILRMRKDDPTMEFKEPDHG